jgi:hypothetical protein
MMRQKRGPKVPVQYDSGEPTFENFAQAPQTPHFNLSKSIAKPRGDGGMMSYPMGVVPLKSLQFGSEQYVEVNVLGQKLKTTQPVMTRISGIESLMNAETILSLTSPKAVYEFNLGIRPGERLLNSVP